MSQERPMFQFVGPFLQAVLACDADGVIRDADGSSYLTAEQAAARAGQPLEAVVALWESSLLEFGGLKSTPEIVDPSTAEPIEDMDPMQRRDRVVRRMLGSRVSESQYEAVKLQAEAAGLNFLTGECWAAPLEDEVTGEVRAVCVAKLEALQKRVLASPFYNGRDPVLYRADGGDWTDRWDGADPPYECKIVMHRKGVDVPHVVTGKFGEHIRMIRKSNGTFERGRFWREQPCFMLAKCVEAKGLRQLYRDMIGNVYIAEELPTPAESRRNAAVARMRANSSKEQSENLEPVSEGGSVALLENESARMGEMDLREECRRRGYAAHIVNEVVGKAKLECDNTDDIIWDRVMMVIAQRVKASRSN